MTSKKLKDWSFFDEFILNGGFSFVFYRSQTFSTVYKLVLTKCVQQYYIAIVR